VRQIRQNVRKSREELDVKRSIATAVVLCFALVYPAQATDPKDCLDLSASQDRDVESPSGVRVTITGRNRCSDSVDSGRVSFTVKAMGNGGVVGSQRGRFGGTVTAQGQVETKVFVVCDPGRVSSVTVDRD
jgi:hypothetical protein